jgi:lipopolysaccharide/colanic/teichoic acid biosynthesis glycosyltransferase
VRDTRLSSIAEAAVIAPVLWIASMAVLSIVPRSVLRGECGARLVRMASRAVKRGLDLLLSSLLLALCSPLFLVVWVATTLDSHGSVIYRQERVGRNRRNGDRRRIPMEFAHDRRNGGRRSRDVGGAPFVIYKFRSMREDAERETGPIWAREDDPRVTRVGRVLRLTRVDEFPQLFNILRGDMSLVGPRPERPCFTQQLAERVAGYHDRTKMRPGVTGLAQVNCAYDSSIESVKEKLEYDLAYVREAGLLLDLKIMVKTVGVMLGRRGAR